MSLQAGNDIKPVGGPADHAVFRGEPRDGARLAGLDGIDRNPTVRPDRDDRLAVGGEGVLLDDRDPLRSDCARLSACQVHDEDADAAAGLAAGEENVASVREELRPLTADAGEGKLPGLSGARGKRSRVSLPRSAAASAH